MGRNPEGQDASAAAFGVLGVEPAEDVPEEDEDPFVEDEDALEGLDSVLALADVVAEPLLRESVE